jgi:glutathionylspermidine synthase
MSEHLPLHTVNLRNLPVSPQKQVEKLGWQWMLGQDTLPYITTDLVSISEAEAEAYREAADELYEMYIAAAQYALDQQLLGYLGIPENLHTLVRHTWDDDRQLHLYGRFDLSGGIGGSPIKLIEFNADTATCIPETAVVQWAHLLANQLQEQLQFNGLFEALRENFVRLKELYPDRPHTLLISTMRDYPEDDTNMAVLGEAAREAGFFVEFAYIDEVEFSPEEGIFSKKAEDLYYQHQFWFKLVPWEFIAYDEPDLADILTKIVLDNKAVILNPAYTLLFQSKALLKILWQLFPQHPLLLETSDAPLTHLPFYVEKVLFGREGANVRILDQSGQAIREEAGEYDEYPKVYQEYTEFVRDQEGHCYQAGVFFAYGACALGYRRGGRIIGNTAQFTGHLII